MRSHLSSEEVEQVVLSGVDTPEIRTVGQDALGEAREHLVACESCHLRVRAHQEAEAKLTKLKSIIRAPKNSTCPAEAVWLPLAAGLAEAEPGEYLEHASECEHCGPLLREATEIVSGELTPAEDVLLQEVIMVDPERLHEFAQRLCGAKIAGPKLPRARLSLGWLRTLPTPVSFALGAGLAAVIAGLAWLALWSRRTEDVDRLLAQAYSQNRIFDLRIAGAAYAPLRQTRGSSSTGLHMDLPRELLAAEAEIGKNVRLRGDDASWLQREGRAYLIEGDYNGAVLSLEKAQRIQPDDAAIETDLASAFYLRAETLKRPEDYGSAVDLLGKVVAVHPSDSVARFNYAISLSKIPLYQQAVEQWERFLADNPRSDWAPEARARLSEVQAKLQQQRERSDRPLRSMQQIAADFEGGREELLSEIDGRVERYMVEAVRTWLPLAYAPWPVDPSVKAARRATVGLASLLYSRHRDLWMTDLLSYGWDSPSIRDAVAQLAESVRLNETSDQEGAKLAANRAIASFRAAHSTAGQLRSRFEIVYADQLSHSNLGCAAAAQDLVRSTEQHSYTWLQVQSEIESAICSSTSDETAFGRLDRAGRVAADHRFRVLQLRAATNQASLYTSVGEVQPAWRAFAASEDLYWQGDYPRLREYLINDTLDYLAEGNRMWFLEAAALRESVPLIADSPDLAMRAAENARLGESLLMTGDLQASEDSFHEAERLFNSIAAGSRGRNLRAEAEIGLAKVELRRGNAQGAVSRLAAIREMILRIPDDDLSLDFSQLYGLASLKNGESAEAEENLKPALHLAERGLSLVSSERDRLRWSRRNGPTYRAMVEISLSKDPRGALAYWEWYKSASLRARAFMGPRGALRTVESYPPQLPDTTTIIGSDVALVSYAVLPSGIVIWVTQGNTTREQWMSIAEPELSRLAQQFAEHCSDKLSNLTVLHEEAAALYKKIFLPVEPFLSIGVHRIVIEPDGALSLVPFTALVDGNDQYLASRYSLALSPGINYLASAQPWRGISRQSKVLVVGDPISPGWTSLYDAEREARRVASIFPQSRLLLGKAAALENIARELPGCEVFHFSGHGVSTTEISGLVLGNSQVLDVPQLSRVQLSRCKLAVLSSCSSGQGTGGLFDDEDSVVRNLVAAGIPEVVASRWNVDSTATADLMKDFYSHLVEGASVPESLQVAMRAMSSRKEYMHPFYWAGFAVFGRG